MDFSVFHGCSGLTTATIGNGVTLINDDAFGDCTGLKEIRCKNAIPPDAPPAFPLVPSSTFYNVDKKTCKLYVPVGSLPAYRTAYGWSDFENIIEEASTAVGSIVNDNIVIYNTNNGIAINADKSTFISIYNIEGVLIYKSIIDAGGHQVTLAKGVYTISADSKRMKVCVR